MVNYWLDLFTGTTWNEFRAAGASITGFSDTRKSTVNKIAKGDILLCYITGIMQWVGALEVLGPSNDVSKIWQANNNSESLQFPIRLEVKPLIMLDPEYGVQMKDLEGKVSFYTEPSDRRSAFKGFVRSSPAKCKEEDGKLIYNLINEAKNNPVAKKIDRKKIRRVPYYMVKSGREEKAVTVPEPEDEVLINECKTSTKADSTDHTRVQYYLLNLGSKMGLSVWVAKNDRSRSFKNDSFESIPRIISELPTQFNEATQKTIELIDVLWLKGNSIIAAFEIESTTSIYSGLLRMSDLIALQPNLQINLYLVAPEERSDKVKKEILRPTFECLAKPLSSICGYISFSELEDKVSKIQELGIASYLNPSFLDEVAEYFTADVGS
ncbi:hypothetical protein [Methanomethylovorans sp.]|uniref:hypothetical protein n=1 Tax=Methanomethylovorans sp. TaxID=2758717 RepID=UPI00351CAA6D